MSKKLDSILARVPSATVSSVQEMETAPSAPELENYNNYPGSSRYTRVVAVVPYSLKQEMKMFLVHHPEDTEKTLILKGLKALEPV